MTEAPRPFVLFLPDPAATTAVAQDLARLLQPGDVLLLDGPVGAGKSHFARALIQARLGRAEDVPSPTFTLVQTYQADVEIWHADLYRLSHPDEVAELGLEEAFHTAICLIEWPDRLAGLTPPDALHLRFEVTPEDARRLTLIGPAPRLAALVGELARD